MGNRLSVAWLCAAVAALTVVVAIVDFQLSLDSIPSIPPRCPETVPYDTACNTSRNDQIAHRLNRLLEVQRDFRRRAQLYGFIVAAALVGATAAGRPRAASRQRRYFSNIGTLGVLVGLFTLFLLWLGGRSSLREISSVQVFYPTFAMLGAAALGGLAASAVRPEPVAAGEAGSGALPGTRRPGGDVLRRLPWVGVVLTALAVVLALTWASAQPGCGELGDGPGWSDTVWGLAVAAMFGALAFGVVSLIVRRWLIALVCIVTAPLAVVFAALTQLCD
jgi:hypothetical protein